jgi:hypothetical protein
MPSAHGWSSDEVNVFTWPGFDLRPIKRGETRVDYGRLPPRFFDQLIVKFTELRARGKVAAASRDEPASASPGGLDVESAARTYFRHVTGRWPLGELYPW